MKGCSEVPECTVRTLKQLDRFAQQPERGMKLRRKELGMLPSGEVPASVDLIEVD